MKRIASFFQTISSHSVAKSSFIVLIGSMGANFFAYLYHLIVGRILGPEKYGELAALLSLFYIFNVPAQSLQAVLTKYFSGLRAKQKTGEAKSLFFLTTRWVIVAEVIGLGILFLSVSTLATFLHIAAKENFFWLYLIFSAFLVSVVELSVYQAYQLFFVSNVLVNVGSVLRLTFGALGALLGVGGVLLSNFFSNVAMYLVSFIPLGFLMKAKPMPVTISKRHALGYSIPAFMTTLGMTALYSQDVLLVKHFFVAKEAGIYSSLSVLGKIIFYASSAIGFVLFPVVAEREELKKGHRTIVYMALAVISAISLLLTGFYFLFPKLVVDLLFGRAFYEAIPYVGYFGLFITFFSLSTLLFTVCLASDKTAVWILATLAALVQIFLIFIYHGTLFSVIVVNLAVAASLFLLLLLYYSYAKVRS